ncbi:MAG: hypothetical protein U0792_13230 [Gemmataceae bacterium]
MRAISGLILLFTMTGMSLPSASAADPVAPNGNWKLNVPLGREGELVLMLALNEQDGKWVADYLTASEKLRLEPKFKSVTVKGDSVQFAMEFGGRDFVSFDGMLSKDKKKITGSISVGGGALQLTEMHPTKLRSLDDRFEVARETLTQLEDGPGLFGAGGEVLAKAAAKKVPAEEIRALLERLNKVAATYGPRWERESTLQCANLLTGQEGFGDLAVAQAKRAERLLTDEDDAATRIKVLETVVKTLTKAGKAADVKPYATQARQARSPRLRRIREVAPVQDDGICRPQGQVRSRRAGGSLHRGRVPAVRRSRSGLRRPHEDVQARGRDAAAIPRSRPGPGPAHEPGLDEAARRLLLRTGAWGPDGVHRW